MRELHAKRVKFSHVQTTEIHSYVTLVNLASMVYHDGQHHDMYVRFLHFLFWAHKLKKQNEVIKALYLRPVDRGSLLAATAAVAAATNTTTAQLLVSSQLVVAVRTDKGWRVSLLTARFF